MLFIPVSLFRLIRHKAVQLIIYFFNKFKFVLSNMPKMFRRDAQPLWFQAKLHFLGERIEVLVVATLFIGAVTYTNLPQH